MLATEALLGRDRFAENAPMHIARGKLSKNASRTLHLYCASSRSKRGAPVLDAFGATSKPDVSWPLFSSDGATKGHGCSTCNPVLQ